MNFRKTFWMNVLLTLLWMALSSLAFLIMTIEHDGWALVKAAIYYCCLIATPLVNALSLKWYESAKLNLLAKIGNWSAIGCTFIYYVVVTYYIYPRIFTSVDIVVYPVTFVLFILPSLITLKALKRA